MKRPAFQFYPADWRNDAALRMCSIAARGLWWEMICVMHSAIPYGHLVAAGKPIAPDELARIVGESKSDVTKWLAELGRREVYSVTDSGAIYSRRMVRDEIERAKWRERQSRHRDVTPNVTPPVTGDVTPQSPRSSSSSSSSRSKEAAAPPDPLWGEGLKVLTTADVSIESARAFIGKALKQWPADTVLDCLREARGTADPKAYTAKLLQSKPRKWVEPDYTAGAR